MNAIFRTNASVKIGAGHAMRCLALAQAMRSKGISSLFLGNAYPDSLTSRINSEGFSIETISETLSPEEDAHFALEFAKKNGAKWVVVDGYDFDSSYHEAIRRSGLRVLVVDDNAHLASYRADIILNPNAYASAGLYSGKLQNSKLLLGGEYCLIRKEIRELQPLLPGSIKKQGRRLMLTFGGTDPTNMTEKALEALSTLDSGSEIVAIIDPQKIARMKSKSVRPVQFVGVNPDIGNEMLKSDLVITAAGGTCWELAFLGVPFFSVVTAQNQLAVQQFLLDSGISESLSAEDFSSENRLVEKVSEMLAAPDRRARMSLAGKSVIDGNGANRVIDAMISFAT